jgi:hypothetical protein
VTLSPADDHFEIELGGALAGMLALAQSGNAGPGGATVSEVFRSSVKVVAGARSHLYRTSLAIPFRLRNRCKHSESCLSV